MTSGRHNRIPRRGAARRAVGGIRFGATPAAANRLVPLAVAALPLLLTLAALSTFSGCARRDRPRNLIVVVIDALRADRLSCYGNPHPTSPAIDRIASEGVLFEQAMAQCSFTPPAMASILTGRYVPAHGLLGWESRLAPAESTLADVLSADGYRTAAFVYLNLLTRHGLDQGFQTGEEMVEGADKLTALARDWIVKDPKTPFFLLLHCYDVHRPYTPPAPYDTLYDPGFAGAITGDNDTLQAITDGRREITAEDARHLAALYDGEIRQTDETLGKFFAWLGQKRLLDKTLLVITSDHGEMLAERADPLFRYTHDPSLYDGVMRIPMIFRGPGVARGVRARAQVREIDVMPSALALLGVETPEDVQGEALFGARGVPRTDDLPAFADVYPEPTRPERYLRAMRLPGAKVIHEIYRGAWEKYDLAADPDEKKNVWSGSQAGASLVVEPGAPEADAMATALLAHAEEMGEVHEICVAWVGRAGERVAGSVSVRGGRILAVDHPPASAAPQVTIDGDSTRATFGADAGPTPSAVWVRVSPPGVSATIEVRDAAGALLPVAVYGREGNLDAAAAPPDTVSFSLPEIGHALINPFESPDRGAYVFGRARLSRQRVPIKLGPEEIERLRALGYIGE